ncbi:MAG TPA: hypothetical protein VIV11_25335 [Kofleriaceae bacterium]
MRCFLISSLLVVSSPQLAFADRKISAAALAELERGEALFRAKEYTSAIKAFDAGYALDPQPIFLYDKAQAQRLAGDCRAAIGTYNAFLATEPAASEASRARKNIENCAALLPPSDPEPVTDAEPAPFEPAPPASTEPPLEVHRESGWWSDRFGVVLITSGAIGIGVGAGFAIAARSAAEDSALATNVIEWSDAQQRWSRNRIIGGIAVGAGAAFVVGGVLRLSLRDRGVAVMPAGNGGAMVSLGGAW